MTFEDVRQTIIKEKPKMVVFTTSTTTIYSDLKIADIAKSVSKDILTVGVGTHFMGLKKEPLGYNKNLDVGVYCEPEWVVLNLVKNGYNPTNVLGVCYRDKDGQIQQNEPQPNIENLDDLGMPSHDKIPIHIYREPISKRHPVTLVMAQRGCIGECTFCCQPAFWKPFRKRDIKYIIKELKWIQKLGYKEIFWQDPGLTYDLKWANQLMDEMIKNKIDLTWSCNDRANSGLSRDPAIIKKMKKAGCHSIRLGLESANSQVLKNVKKNTTPEQVTRTAALIKKEGLEVLIYFMLGLPGETRKSINETIDFIKVIDVDYITLGIAQPYPGTHFYDYLIKNKYLKTKDWSKYDPMEMPVYEYPQISSQEILQAHYRGLRSFYLRPSYILKRALKIQSFHELKNNFKNFIGFMNRYVWLNLSIKK